jgi:hypothetical protein
MNPQLGYASVPAHLDWVLPAELNAIAEESRTYLKEWSDHDLSEAFSWILTKIYSLSPSTGESPSTTGDLHRLGLCDDFGRSISDAFYDAILIRAIRASDAPRNASEASLFALVALHCQAVAAEAWCCLSIGEVHMGGDLADLRPRTRRLNDVPVGDAITIYAEAIRCAGALLGWARASHEGVLALGQEWIDQSILVLERVAEGKAKRSRAEQASRAAGKKHEKSRADKQEAKIFYLTHRSTYRSRDHLAEAMRLCGPFSNYAFTTLKGWIRSFDAEMKHRSEGLLCPQTNSLRAEGIRMPQPLP